MSTGPLPYDAAEHPQMDRICWHEGFQSRSFFFSFLFEWRGWRIFLTSNAHSFGSYNLIPFQDLGDRFVSVVYVRRYYGLRKISTPSTAKATSSASKHQDGGGGGDSGGRETPSKLASSSRPIITVTEFTPGPTPEKVEEKVQYYIPRKMAKNCGSFSQRRFITHFFFCCCP